MAEQDILTAGPEAGTEPQIEELPPMEKDPNDMTPEELLERLRLERRFLLKQAGVTEEQVDAWKKDFGRIGSVIAGDTTYVYRPIKRGEYRRLVQLSLQNQEIWRRELDFTESIVELCTLHPQQRMVTLRNESYAGVAEVLSQAIQQLSGWGAEATILEL